VRVGRAALALFSGLAHARGLLLKQKKPFTIFEARGSSQEPRGLCHQRERTRQWLGNPLSTPSSIFNPRAGIVTAAGDAKYGFHKLRNFFASWAIGPKRLQEILGARLDLTYDVHGHWFPDSADDQARLVAGRGGGARRCGPNAEGAPRRRPISSSATSRRRRRRGAKGGIER
jgi:hypothetical protein